MRPLARSMPVRRLVTLLAALGLGACSEGYAPAEEQGAQFQRTLTCVQESLAPAEAEELTALRRSALEAAERVDPERLRRLHVAMPRHFRGALVQGLQLWVRGAREEDPELLAQGELAIRRWDDWYREARREITAE